MRHPVCLREPKCEWLYTRGPTPKLTDSDQRLVAELGVYGVWILKHGKKLPATDLAVKDLHKAYERYVDSQAGSGSGLLLMAEIDRVVRWLDIEPPGKNYTVALREYLSLPGPTETGSTTRDACAMEDTVK